jgi:hypothetical protein
MFEHVLFATDSFLLYRAMIFVVEDSITRYFACALRKVRKAKAWLQKAMLLVPLTIGHFYSVIPSPAIGEFDY